LISSKSSLTQILWPIKKLLFSFQQADQKAITGERGCREKYVNEIDEKRRKMKMSSLTLFYLFHLVAFGPTITDALLLINPLEIKIKLFYDLNSNSGHPREGLSINNMLSFRPKLGPAYIFPLDPRGLKKLKHNVPRPPPLAPLIAASLILHESSMGCRDLNPRLALQQARALQSAALHPV
jgi:hypothetical protein